MSDRILTADLLARLQRHYIKPGDPMPGGMFMPEVELHGRRADALYVGFFASRGKTLVGHEIKVSRADWRHELDQPGKAEVWFSECHSWYVVAPSTSIVPPEELPPGWGLMVPGTRTRTRMEVVVKAALDESVQPSWAATHALVQKADSLRMAATAAIRQRLAEESQAEVEKRVESALRISGGEAHRDRADRAEALLKEVGGLLGFTITGEQRSWGDYLSVPELRASLAAWIRADRASDIAVRAQLSNIGNLRAVLDTYERTLRGDAS